MNDEYDFRVPRQCDHGVMSISMQGGQWCSHCGAVKWDGMEWKIPNVMFYRPTEEAAKEHEEKCKTEYVSLLDTLKESNGNTKRAEGVITIYKTKLEAAERELKYEHQAVMARHNRIDDDTLTINRQCVELGRLRSQLAGEKRDTVMLDDFKKHTKCLCPWWAINDRSGICSRCRVIDAVRQSSAEGETKCH